MVVDDLDVVCISSAPDETQPPLSVDADAVLPGAVTLELFEAIRRRDSQVVERGGRIEHAQLSQGDALNVGSWRLDALSMEETLGVPVSEARRFCYYAARPGC